jgi:hypothetical protein
VRPCQPWPAGGAVRTLQEVHEVDPYRLFGLADLPVLPAAAALELFSEEARLVGQRAVRRGAHEKPPDPANAMRSCLLLDQRRLQQELPELLQRRLQLLHDVSPRGQAAKPKLPGHTFPSRGSQWLAQSCEQPSQPRSTSIPAV